LQNLENYSNFLLIVVLLKTKEQNKKKKKHQKKQIPTYWKIKSYVFGEL